MQFGSPIEVAAQQFTLGQEDLLGGGPIAVPAVGAIFSGSVQALNSYRSILFLINGGSPIPLVANILNQIALGLPSYSFAGAFNNNPSGFMQCHLPVACKAGDTLAFNIYFAANPGAGVQLTVIGLTATDPPKYRSDGRLYPMGTNLAQANVTVTTTLVPAPGLGLRLHIAYLAWDQIGANGGAIQITVNAVTTFLHESALAGGMAGPLHVPEKGILCDASTGISLVTSGGNTIMASCLYDFVA